MSGEELDAISSALGQGTDVRKAVGITECYCGRRCIGATAEGAGLESRGVSLLRTGCPNAVAIIAECEGDPRLV
jgi:hypothetical protein